MKEDLNGRGPQRKTTSMEDDILEDDPDERQTECSTAVKPINLAKLSLSLALLIPRLIKISLNKGSFQ